MWPSIVCGSKNYCRLVKTDCWQCYLRFAQRQTSLSHFSGTWHFPPALHFLSEQGKRIWIHFLRGSLKCRCHLHGGSHQCPARFLLIWVEKAHTQAIIRDTLHKWDWKDARLNRGAVKCIHSCFFSIPHRYQMCKQGQHLAWLLRSLPPVLNVLQSVPHSEQSTSCWVTSCVYRNLCINISKTKISALLPLGLH